MRGLRSAGVERRWTAEYPETTLPRGCSVGMQRWFLERTQGQSHVSHSASARHHDPLTGLVPHRPQPQIKGTHNAMKSGMMAAETAYAALHPDKQVEISKNSLYQPLDGTAQEAVDMSPYETAFKQSWVYKELNEVRNLRPSFHNPLGIDSLILKGRTPWTLRNTWEDHAATKKASECQKIEYPAPDGKLSFDILTSVSLTGTNHAEDQPVHLRLPKDEGARARHTETNVNGEQGIREPTPLLA
jgi:hypothetical protein